MFQEFIELYQNLYKNYDFKNRNREIELQNRKILDEKLLKYKTVHPTQYQGVIFKVGRNGAVHSEPDMNSNRLFLSIVPGSKDEILELAKMNDVVFF